METYKIYDENCQCAFVAEVRAENKKAAIKAAKIEKNIKTRETKFRNGEQVYYTPKLYAIEQ
jgi:hypothetical protein